jgi:regulatory protein
MAPPVSLKVRALQWLAQREHSRLELRRKLLSVARRRDADIALRRASADAADPALSVHDEPVADPVAEVEALLDALVAERHLSEARFVESRLHARTARFGQRRITQELAQHGVDLDPQAVNSLRATELDRARAVWLRKYGNAPPADAASRARQMRFLAGRGFDAEVIRRVLRGSDDD